MKCNKHNEEKQDLFSNGEFYCESCFLEYYQECEICEDEYEDSYNSHDYCRNHYELATELGGACG